MSNGSPTAYLLWAILSCIFLAFLLQHLWAYDRFNCLKWDSGRQPGAFKRVMTYSYVATLPLLVIFSVTLTAFKFKEGYLITEDGQITPRPLQLWALQDRHWLLPLYFILSCGWSLELVTHLEELSFWLFLMNQGPGKRDWFDSWEFRIWYLGSIIAVLGMPLTTLVSRKEIETVQLWIFLAGASAGTFTTLCFLYVLFRFPRFIMYVKDGGAEPDVVVRLATFYSLNRVRVLFRFLFTIPLLIIAIDGVTPSPFPIIDNAFAVGFAIDFLLMMGGIGCFISSAITLLIFFPRSITRESGYKAKIISGPHLAKAPAATSPLPDYHYSERDPTTPKAHDPSSPSSAMRMSAFRYPVEPQSPQEYRVHETRSEPAHPRESVESVNSPGYESDAESIAMASPSTVQFASVPRHDSSQTAISRPTSGGRSEDTVWERQDELSPSGRRRYSGGPFMYHRQGAMLAPIPNSIHASEDGNRSSDRDLTTTTPSHLHPYVSGFDYRASIQLTDWPSPVCTLFTTLQVINFTSPIDLLDTPPEEPLPPHPPHLHIV
ncbi:hypothetical protein CPB84DRAFT_1671675 [Gymnopilus junonius]|uniref:Transmembrane protein n=1 Tax=Gymnopilus junonius TaxID=109634 RepID=A0A9P5P1I1_GYMJU|nr:hypothetical protein CPB84DRAFT_1671675 [Gymnopilus junonius]